MLNKLKDIYVPVMGIVDDSVVDGKRLRLAVFVQGCPRHCQDCHNPQSWAFTKENMVSLNEIYTRVEENALCSGITLSGREPFIYTKELALLADAVKAGGKNVWAFSGWTYEQISKKEDVQELLRHIDVLVDGLFESDKKKRLVNSCSQSFCIA